MGDGASLTSRRDLFRLEQCSVEGWYIEVLAACARWVFWIGHFNLASIISTVLFKGPFTAM